MKQSKKNFREEMANFFVNGLEENPIEFIQSWNFTQTGSPINYYTEKEYNGINKLYLKLLETKYGFGDNRWLTFTQIKNSGLSLTKGAKGAKVEYYIPFDTKEKKWASWNDFKEDEKNGTTGRYILKPRLYTVFNGYYIKDIPKFEKEYIENDIKEQEIVKRISKSLGVTIEERENSQSAYYDVNNDKIVLPRKEQFKSDGHYISTALHELGHSTAHQNRLNRDLTGGFGSTKYGFEELVAEMTSAFLGEYVEKAKIEDVLDNNKAYIQSWIKAIKKDKNFLWKAIKEADKATSYIVEQAELVDFKKEITEKKEIKTSLDNDEIEKKTRSIKRGDRREKKRDVEIEF